MANVQPTEVGRLGKLLARKGLKFTHERQLILDAVLEQKKHFDADAFYEKLKKTQRISRDTVYRTLPLLLECGILQKSVGDGRRDYFERTGARGHHDHMVCIDCGKVLEFHSEAIERFQDEVCREVGFELVFHDHRLFGHCKNCQ